MELTLDWVNSDPELTLGWADSALDPPASLELMSLLEVLRELKELKAILLFQFLHCHLLLPPPLVPLIYLLHVFPTSYLLHFFLRPIFLSELCRLRLQQEESARRGSSTKSAKAS